MTAEPAGGTLALPETGTAPRAAGRGRRVPWISIGIIVAFVAAAVVAPLVSPADPYAQSLRNRFKPPVWEEGGTSTHPLGTDRLGRDMLARILYGARVSLAVGALNVVIAISVILWARYARVMRGEVLTLMQLDFIAQARIAGAGAWRIITRHLVPNTLNTLVVLITLQVGYVIIVEAALSFLGAGIPPPTPAWGSMIAEGRDFVTSAWWVSFLPGLAIMLVVLAFNLLGDWLRDTLDPKLRQL